MRRTKAKAVMARKQEREEKVRVAQVETDIGDTGHQSRLDDQLVCHMQRFTEKAMDPYGALASDGLCVQILVFRGRKSWFWLRSEHRHSGLLPMLYIFLVCFSTCFYFPYYLYTLIRSK